MGWLKSKFLNLSLKKSFALYMLIFLLLATALSSITINLAGNIKNQINLSYKNSDNQYTLNNSSGKVVVVSAPVDYNQKDTIIITICNYIEIWSIPIFFGICIVLSSLFFYRNKLKKPIELLGSASEKIASNDLDFHLVYDSKDEMGQLCSSFEVMRGALEENNRVMWRTLEERKRLNAAFSHNLRTPLTVLRGYSDLLGKYLPQGRISEEKLLSTVSTMSEHIARMENYVRMMSEVQKLEDVAVEYQDVQSELLFEQLQSTADMLVKDTDIRLVFDKELPKSIIHLDMSLVIIVYENIIANAVRYAKSEILIRYQYFEGKILISVKDDGEGFTDDDLQQVTKPYYRNQTETEEYHFGLGLYICRILCEKHGGNIIIENNKNGGAKVTTSFSSIYLYTLVDKK